MAFFGKSKDKEIENHKSKEENMSSHQSNLEYTKVQQAFNKIKNNKKANYDSLKANLNNFSSAFNDLSNDDKQEELKSEKFEKLFIDINSLNNRELSKIIESIESQRELSEYENLSQQIKLLTNKLEHIEKENLKVQGSNIDDIAYSTENISKIINESFWNKLKQSIPIPKLDLSSITQKIEDIKKELKFNKTGLDNSNKELAKRIDNIKFPSFPTPPTIPTDYLKKDDFEFMINDKLKDLKTIKESSEDLEAVPAKVNDIDKKIDALSDKMDNLPSSNGSQSPKHIPKEEKSVIELAEYMNDGIAQFENIAKAYISKISELEKFDKIKESHQNELEQVKKYEFENGKKEGKIELIKNLAEKFPTEFIEIKSTFEEFIEEKFKKDESLEITDNNKNEMMPFIENEIENAKYRVIKEALLVDGEILLKAHVEILNSDKVKVED